MNMKIKTKDQMLLEEAYSKINLKEEQTNFDSADYAMKKYDMSLQVLNDLIDEEGENAWDYFRSFQSPADVDDYIQDLL